MACIGKIYRYRKWNKALEAPASQNFLPETVILLHALVLSNVYSGRLQLQRPLSVVVVSLMIVGHVNG